MAVLYVVPASTLIKRSVCGSLVEISHTFMEMPLNLVYFTDFYLIEILTNLFSFFFLCSFYHPNCYLKLSLFRLKHYLEFSRFLQFGKLVSLQRHSYLGPYKLPNSSAPQKISERARLFILINPVIICIHFKSNQLPFSLSALTAAFQIRKNLVITPAYLLKLRSSFMQLSLRFQNSGYMLL